ncbi:MAG TPA: proline racemase family protein [Solirubrobacteraceae bacterium]|nr:proline racemase family protein [Solirubrobacteraceae bacterium]
MKVIRTVETHCGGPHCRVVIGGLGALDIPGQTMFEKKSYLEQNYDAFRRLLLTEPRSSRTTNVDLILPSPDPRADFGVVIMEQARYYPAMSGGNLMSVVTALLETGSVTMTEPDTLLNVDTPAGLVAVRARCKNGRVTNVAFANAPAFATHLDTTIEVSGIGPLLVDVAYGGMFYVLAEAAAVGLAIEPESAAELVRVGEVVKKAAREQLRVVHPANHAINHLESLLWWGPARSKENDGRNTVVVSLDAGIGSEIGRGVLDRCPCGTGTCARLAVLHAKRQLRVGEDYRHEGILDSVFIGRILQELDIDGTPAIVPEVSGQLGSPATRTTSFMTTIP